jgi:Small Multidrug Resistance (SMR) protein
MPTGVVDALWSGLTIVLITAIAWVWSKQAWDAPSLIGCPHHRWRDRADVFSKSEMSDAIPQIFRMLSGKITFD